MKHIITLLSLLFFNTASNAQNLVPNYSFEEADSCPTNLNDRTFEYSLGCVGWGQATSGTADYYNACDTAAVSIGRQFPYAGVPNNNLGYQYAFEGTAYTGITLYYSDIIYYKEYLFTNIAPLEIDTPYIVTIHVSLADSSKYATDGIGVLFTTYGSPGAYEDTTLTQSPQIDYTSYGIISDTVNWTTLSSIFIADSAYTNLIIGGFKNSNHMNISVISNYLSNNAYYYIDNVIVEKVSTTALNSLSNNINEAKISPNPFSDHTTLIFNNPYNLKNSLTIFNVQGQIVQYIDNISSDRVRIERDNLPSGFYYYQLSNTNGIVSNGKLIIK